METRIINNTFKELFWKERKGAVAQGGSGLMAAGRNDLLLGRFQERYSRQGKCDDGKGRERAELYHVFE